jgi:hypothetical protein
MTLCRTQCSFKKRLTSPRDAYFFCNKCAALPLQVAVENLIIKKGNVRKDKLKTYVIWSGLLYGCGEGVLHSLFRCSWLGTHKTLPILGLGHNKVPMIHVSDMAGVVLSVAQKRPAEFSTVLAVDRGEICMGEVVKAISASLQSGEVKNVGTDEYLAFMTKENEPHIHSVLLKLNIKMAFDRAEALGYGPESEAWVAGSGFVANIQKVLVYFYAADDLCVHVYDHVDVPLCLNM